MLWKSIDNAIHITCTVHKVWMTIIIKCTFVTTEKSKLKDTNLIIRQEFPVHCMEWVFSWSHDYKTSKWWMRILREATNSYCHFVRFPFLNAIFSFSLYWFWFIYISITFYWYGIFDRSFVLILFFYYDVCSLLPPSTRPPLCVCVCESARVSHVFCLLDRSFPNIHFNHSRIYMYNWFHSVAFITGNSCFFFIRQQPIDDTTAKCNRIRNNKRVSVRKRQGFIWNNKKAMLMRHTSSPVRDSR